MTGKNRSLLNGQWLVLLVSAWLISTSPVLAESAYSTNVGSLSVKIFNRYMQRARAGEVKSQLEVAHRLENGKGAQQNLIQAFFWYQKAAEQGSVEAQYKIGTMLETGSGVTKNLDQAQQWYEKAAAQAYKPAVARIVRLTKASRAAKQKAEQKAKAQAERQAERKARQEARVRAAQRKQQEEDRLRKERRKLARIQREQAAIQLKKRQHKVAEDRSAHIASSTSPGEILAKLNQGNWMSGNAAVDFLPSTQSRCIQQGKKLSCFTSEREVLVAQNSVRYMAQSTIEVSGHGQITVNYRYQVTRVHGAADGLESHRGPDHPLPDKGWQDAFNYLCRFPGDNMLECLDNTGRHFTLTRTVAATAAAK